MWVVPPARTGKPGSWVGAGRWDAVLGEHIKRSVVESEMPIGHPKVRWQVGSWLVECGAQKKGLDSGSVKSLLTNNSVQGNESV